jgi:hypothetical protein
MNRGTLLVVGLVVATLVAPAAAFGSLPTGGDDPAAQATPTATPTANGSVDVTVGDELATVIQAENSTVQAAVSDASFDARYENASAEERPALLTNRAEGLERRATALSGAYRNATAAHEAGELSDREYARQLAVLAAAADALLADHRELQRRAGELSAFDLRAAGYDEASLRDALGGVDPLTGSGANALLARFTGERDGEVEVETDGGLSIEVSSEDGERTREFERTRDDDDATTVGQSDALATARAALSPADGNWTLVGSSVDRDDGVYTFEFALRGGDATGEAEVSVDGSSGAVFALEEEIAPRDDDEREEDDEADDEEEDDTDERDDDEEEEDDETDDGDDDRSVDELALVLTDGDPAPNATVTVAALADGERVGNATVRAGDRVLGTTGTDGTLTVRLPDREEVELTATYADEDAELEFEFERDDDRALLAAVSLDGTLGNGTATLRVAHDGDPVTGASVTVDGEHVGETDVDGRVSFAVADGPFSVTVTQGSLALSAILGVEDGSLVVREGPVVVDEEREEEEDDDADDGDADDEDDGDADDEDDGDADDEDDDTDDEDDGDEDDDTDD